MSQYVVITPDGKRYGPTDFQTLAEWALDGRVMPGMMVEDLLSGQTMAASGVPGLQFTENVPQYVNYPRTGPAQRPAGSHGLTSMVLGLVGLVAWCIPLIGFPISIMAIILGVQAMKGIDRSKAIAGVVLGSVCLLLSAGNGILGAIMVLNSR